MGFIKRVVKSQLIDSLQWTSPERDSLVHRVDTEGKELLMGARLIVGDEQAVLFLNDGRMADLLLPGTYTLSTQTLPVLTAQRAWTDGYQSPFKAEVFFISTRMITNQIWAASSPVMIRDTELGMVRTSVSGSYAFGVSDPAAFMKQALSAAQWMTAEGVNAKLAKFALSCLSDVIAEAGIQAHRLAPQAELLAEVTRRRLNERLAAYGFTVGLLLIDAMDLPEEIASWVALRPQAEPFEEEDLSLDDEPDEQADEDISDPPHLTLIEGVPAVPYQALACPVCGEPLSLGARLCPACGADLL